MGRESRKGASVWVSPVHQCGLDRPAGPLGAETAPSPANPESGGQSRKRKKRGTEEIAGISVNGTLGEGNSIEALLNTSLVNVDEGRRVITFGHRNGNSNCEL